MNLTSRTARRVAVAAAVACAALVAPAIALASPVSPARTAAPATPPCETPGLVEWLDTNGSGAAGSTFYTMNFTNLSGHACTLNGFPFLFAVSLTGKQIGSDATFNHHPAPRTVTIGNGKTVTAQLQIVVAQNYSKSLCGKVVTAAGLKVFPPNQQRAKIIPFPFSACESTHAQILTVGAVR